MKNIIIKYKKLSVSRQIGIALLVFIIGLFVLPNTFVYISGIFFAYKLINKKSLKYITVGLFCIIAFFSLVLSLSQNILPTNSIDNVDTSQTLGENIDESNLDQNNIVTDTSTEATTTSVLGEKTEMVQDIKTQSSSSQIKYYSVTEVVDGDTLKINIDGKVETLRLIGMDTPETVDPRKSVQCFGTEASNQAKKLLSGKKVRIETDPTQGERDKYNRLLVYVYRDDGIFYNKYMIEQGYAYEYTYNTPYKYQKDFKSAQNSAEINKLGLWSPDTCNGNTTSSNTSTTQNQNTVTPPPTTTTTQSSGKFYVSSHHTSKYWYPEICDGWKSLSTGYLKSFNTLDALLAVYPTKIKSPQCE